MIATTSGAGIDIDWDSRVRGALLLSAWADAAAATARLTAEAPQAPTSPPRSARSRSMWVLAEHLAYNGGAVDQAALGRALVASGSGGAAAGRVRMPPARSWTGTSMASRGLLPRPGVISTVPVGLVPGIGLPTVARRARRAAAVGQAHPQVLDVAAVQAVAVAVAIRSPTAEPVDAEAMVARVTSQVRTSELLAVLRRVPPLVRLAATPQRVAMGLHNQPQAVAAVAVALTAFLTHPGDPVAAIGFLRRAGDDTGAAALTSALCGARHGESVLPHGWQVPERLARVADSLAALNQRG